MSLDIFGHQAAVAGSSFSADDAFMTFPTPAGVVVSDRFVPAILQNAAFNYAQQITRLFDLASNRVFYVRGRAQGQGKLGQVLGPTALSQAFMHRYGNVCNAATNAIRFEMAGGCRNPTAAGALPWSEAHAFTAMFVVIDQMGIQMTAEQMVIQTDVNIIIGTFVIDGAGGAGAVGSGTVPAP